MGARNVIITGAASGLGRALAEAYGAAGYRVLLSDVNAAGLTTAQHELRAKGVTCEQRVCDVRREEEVEALIDTAVRLWGGLDVIINNAGVAAHGKIDEQKSEDFRWILDINLVGVLHGARAAARLFKRQGTGRIINIASMAGLLNAPEMSAYNVTKAGVVALSETLRSELAPYGVGVSVVCPGFFATELAKSLRSPAPGMQNMVEKLMARSSLSANDVAEIVLRQSEKNRFYILPHRDMHALWFLKRLLPSAYLRAAAFAGERMARKRGESGARDKRANSEPQPRAD
jgi:NAD(P)-dependent dehydrogenase (short-subunit alcohol dehydrogenase family)